MKHFNLIVAGGGLSGVAAAVSAAREGLSVLLIEKSGCLGGAISNNLVYPFTKYWTRNPETNEKKYLSKGIFAEIREIEAAYYKEFKEPDSDYPQEFFFRPELYKMLLDDIVTEAGVNVLFHSLLIETRCEGRNVKSALVATVSGTVEFTADFFIDATGNGDLFYQAGCDFQNGRESDEFSQPMTTCFRMSGVDIPMFVKDADRLQKLYKEQKKTGNILNDRENILWFVGIGEGILHLNTTRVIKHNPTDAIELSKAEILARKQVRETIRFFKENSKAFEKSTVISIATEIGVRESRKLKGVHILTVDELKNLTDFEDSIALGNYDIDIHNPIGEGTSHYYFKKGDFYKIPYRCLLPKEYDNLLVAGRCISATHEAQASIRIMAICTCLGEAAGTAAALSFKTGSNAHTVDIKALQNKLIKNGAVL